MPEADSRTEANKVLLHHFVGARDQSWGHFETESPLPDWEVRLSPTHVAEPSDVGDSSSRRAAWPDGKT